MYEILFVTSFFSSRNNFAPKRFEKVERNGSRKSNGCI